MNDKIIHTLQSKANLRASMMAAFLSRSDSNANTKESPCFACQNNAWAAAFPPPLTPHSYRTPTNNIIDMVQNHWNKNKGKQLTL